VIDEKTFSPQKKMNPWTTKTFPLMSQFLDPLTDLFIVFLNRLIGIARSW
jgi:hypothetical protein